MIVGRQARIRFAREAARQGYPVKHIALALNIRPRACSSWMKAHGITLTAKGGAIKRESLKVPQGSDVLAQFKHPDPRTWSPDELARVVQHLKAVNRWHESVAGLLGCSIPDALFNINKFRLNDNGSFRVVRAKRGRPIRRSDLGKPLPAVPA